MKILGGILLMGLGLSSHAQAEISGLLQCKVNNSARAAIETWKINVKQTPERDGWAECSDLTTPDGVVAVDSCFVFPDRISVTAGGGANGTEGHLPVYSFEVTLQADHTWAGMQNGLDSEAHCVLLK